MHLVALPSDLLSSTSSISSSYSSVPVLDLVVPRCGEGEPALEDEEDNEVEEEEDDYLRQQLVDDLESIHLREILQMSHDEFEFEFDDVDETDLVQKLLLDDENDSEEEESVAVIRRRSGARVTFGTVQVREYGVTLGDHPLCHQYPMSLDWAHAGAKTYEGVDAHEFACQSLSNKRRLRLNRDERLARLEKVTGIDSLVWEEREEHRLLELLEEREMMEEENRDDDDDECDSDDDDGECDSVDDSMDDSCASSTDSATETLLADSRCMTTKKKRVTFGPVHVREYRVIHGEGNCLALVDGRVHHEEEGWLLLEHPATRDYPVTLDWAHADAQVCDLDWYEATKSQDECRYLSSNERRVRVCDVAGIDASVLEWKERQRIQREKQQWLRQVLVEMERSSDDDDELPEEEEEEEEASSTRAEEAAVAVPTAAPRRRAARGARRPALPAGKAPLPIVRRRSARLASQVRCSYRV